MRRKRGGGACLWAVLQLSATPWHTEHAECQVVVGENGWGMTGLLAGMHGGVRWSTKRLKDLRCLDDSFCGG